MDITWLGHSCFRVRGVGATLLTDPFPPGIGLKVSPAHANVVTISSAHPNHSCLQWVEGTPRVLTGPGEYEVARLYARGMGIPVTADGGAAWNTVFFVEMEGLVLCHLGDLAQPLSGSQVKGLVAPDVLFVPAGGRCTLTPAQAAEMVNRMSPKVVVPMHYALPGLQVELDPLAVFLREMGLKEAEAQPRLTVTRATLPAGTRVVVLRPLALP